MEEKDIIEYHDGLTEKIIEDLTVYRLTITPYQGARHIHYYDSPFGDILVELITWLIQRHLDVEKIEIEHI